MNTSQTTSPAPRVAISPSKPGVRFWWPTSTAAPHALFDASLVDQLKALVDRADKDPDIHAVVFTGTHPERFLSHSDVEWLQQGGVGFPPINTTIAGIVTRMARTLNKVPVIRSLARMTRMKPLLDLDQFHATFLKMNASGVVFVAALNGTALAVGAEFAMACDLRIMADGDHVFGLSEVLLALTPGGGGSQRLPRLIGNQRALLTILDGKPFTPAEALPLAPSDEVVPQGSGPAARHRTRRIPQPAGQGIHRGDQAVDLLRHHLVAGRRPATRTCEFLVRDQDPEAQRRMLAYIAETKATGELPLMNRATYAHALKAGGLGL